MALFLIFRMELDKQIYEAARLMAKGRLKKAEPILRSCLKNNPLDVNAMKLLADVGVEFRAYKEAGFLLSRALDLEPDYHEARFSYANLLYKRQLPLESLEELDKLLISDPQNIQYLSLKAVNFALANQHDLALKSFTHIIENYPVNNQIYLSYGHTLRAVGNFKEAINAYQKAISFKKGAGEAYWSLANLKTYKFNIEDLNHIKTLLADKKCLREDYYHLLFALGKAKEDLKEYESSMAAYMKGNSVKSKIVPWDVQGFKSECNELKEFFTTDFFNSKPEVGCSVNDPIFIVGLPRSGSTLVEQVLSTHSKVEGTSELQNITALARKIANKKNINDASQFPVALNQLDNEEFLQMGKAFIQNTRTQRITNKPFFTDKMPSNFIYIGLIHLILPNAKIIDVRRNPMDCCFSCYKQLFGSGWGFTYSLDRIGNYYLDYLDLMEHWDKALPGKVHRIVYEDMVINTEEEIKKLLNYCNLDFEEECLNFHQNKRAVRTPSSEQVRQPIYSSGMNQWKPYTEWLEPLLTKFN
jgi:tetratricopeptide (TPR) repeat protein|tara:strand:- start:2699 stop:4282 length:1584 start_codon:yes stop_codon:yes gene_type:complete